MKMMEDDIWSHVKNLSWRGEGGSQIIEGRFEQHTFNQKS
jgi:hypothetical protein